MTKEMIEFIGITVIVISIAVLESIRDRENKRLDELELAHKLLYSGVSSRGKLGRFEIKD